MLPCSSTGTIRRHPDVQWTKSPQIIEQLAELQYQMVLRASQFLKPGGTLVFANCSLDRAEGEDVYSRVLASTDDLQPAPISSDEVFGQDEFTNRQGTVRTLPCHLQSPWRTGFEWRRFALHDRVGWIFLCPIYAPNMKRIVSNR